MMSMMMRDGKGDEEGWIVLMSMLIFTRRDEYVDEYMSMMIVKMSLMMSMIIMMNLSITIDQLNYSS